MNKHLKVHGDCITSFMEDTDKLLNPDLRAIPRTQGNNTSIGSCNYLFEFVAMRMCPDRKIRPIELYDLLTQHA